MESQHVKSLLESLLFVASKPLSIKELSRFLELPLETVQTVLEELRQERREAGVIVLESNGLYQMATNSTNSNQVKDFLNQDLREKLTDATVEVLGIIAYRQPISKAEIEAIRGVNSQYGIRHLLMRGMIEKIPNPTDARGSLYQTTTEFLQHLGLHSVQDLPEFEKLVGEIQLPETPALKQEAVDTSANSQSIEEPGEVVALVIEEPQKYGDEPRVEAIIMPEDTASNTPVILTETTILTDNKSNAQEFSPEDENEYDGEDDDESDTNKAQVA